MKKLNCLHGCERHFGPLLGRVPAFASDQAVTAEKRHGGRSIQPVDVQRGVVLARTDVVAIGSAAPEREGPPLSLHCPSGRIISDDRCFRIRTTTEEFPAGPAPRWEH